MKTLENFINESRKVTMRCSFVGCADSKGENFSVDLLIPIDKVKDFEKFAEKEQDNIFVHFESDNIEY